LGKVSGQKFEITISQKNEGPSGENSLKIQYLSENSTKSETIWRLLCSGDPSTLSKIWAQKPLINCESSLDSIFSVIAIGYLFFVEVNRDT
jgi:hypothetical protein